MTKNKIAKVCHEVNRAYCQAFLDDSILPWDQAPEWQKESAIKGVEQLLLNPSLTPRAIHNLWMQEKERNGWKYGPVKDEELKEHPCMMSYDMLPPSQRAKDYIFAVIVRELSMIKTYIFPGIDLSSSWSVTPPQVLKED